MPQIAVKIYTVRFYGQRPIFVNTSARRRNDLKSSIARKSFTGATSETICKILQTSEKPAFSLSSRVPSTGLSHPSLGTFGPNRSPLSFDRRNYVQVVFRGKEKSPRLRLGRCRVSEFADSI